MDAPDRDTLPAYYNYTYTTYSPTLATSRTGAGPNAARTCARSWGSRTRLRPGPYRNATQLLPSRSTVLNVTLYTMPPALPPLLPDDDDPLAQDLSQTAQALPFSDSAIGGQPTQLPDVPERPERPDLPRVDPEDFPGGRPERDQDARNRQAIQGLLGAVGAALAPQDSPVAFNVASGLSQGAAEQARTSEEEFRQRQQAFREFVTDAQRYNRKAKQAEAEQEFESRLADFKGRMGQREQVIEGELERRRAARERRQEVWDDYRDHQQSIEEIRARGRERRKNAAVRDALEGGQAGGDGVDLPATIEETERMIEQRIQDEQQASDRGATSDELRSIQDDIRLLKQHRDSLRQRTDSTRTDSTAAPADTSRAGRTAPADTTASDTTTTRGLGRSPRHVSPEELGMKTSGGNPGGGGGKPSSGGARLNADLMGSGDVGARSTESLVDDALTVVWNRGPREAERRLDGLVNQGHLDAQTARTVRRRMELVRGYDRIAVEHSPEAALDSLEADLNRGDVSPEEAHRLIDRIEERYAR